MPEWEPHVRPRLASLRLPPTRENEIVDELSQHLEDRWCELVAGGASPEDATRLALADFRDADVLARRLATLRQTHPRETIEPGAAAGRHLVADLWQDLRYAARTLKRQPGFTIAAVLTLALGIGANAAIFSVIDAVLLRPLPYPHGDRLVALYSRFLPASGYDFPFMGLSGPEFTDIQRRTSAFAHVAAFAFSGRNLTRANGTTERVQTMPVTAQFFDVLGVHPARGRIFTDAEAQSGGCLAVLADDSSTRGANVLGSTIRLDDAPCEVVGVMPAGFTFRDDAVKVWTALAIDHSETSINRQSHGLLAIARLRAGVSAELADAQLQSLRAFWSETYPDHYAKGHFAVSVPLHEDLVGDQRDALVMLGGAVLFVLLIVCVNLAALLVSNGEGRRREFAVRHALGANRRRLVRQMVAEAMLLAILGGGTGVFVANAMLGTLLALYPGRLPATHAVGVDYLTLLYTAAVVIVVGILIGIVPALTATGARMQDALRADSRTAAGSRRALIARSGLVVAQLAVSVILLAGAVLLIRSYQELRRVDLGIETNDVLTFDLFVPPARQPDPAAARRTLAAIEARLAVAAGVRVVGATSALPLASGGGRDDFVIDGRAMPAPGAPRWNAGYVMVTPQLFRAFGIPLKRGRLIADTDTAGTPLVALINETAARLYWQEDDPIGQTIRYYPTDTSPAIQIVGVVGDVRWEGARMPVPPAVYVPVAQAPRPPYEGRSMTFVLGAAGKPSDVVGSARAAVASVEAGLPLANVRSMEEVVAETANQPRFTAIVMTFFASAAFVLAAVGLYGILAHSVQQRTREIGVRVALGAGRREIFRLIVANGMSMTLVGVIVGVPAALAATRMMTGVLTGVTPTDPLTYVAVVAILAASAFVASYLPARRATRVDPLVALRAE
jgi:putative ABC transport system permease protein